MAVFMLIAGVLCMLLGAVWLLQGLNILGGSVMSGVSFWAWMGLLLLVVGLVVINLGIRRRVAKRS